MKLLNKISAIALLVGATSLNAQQLNLMSENGNNNSTGLINLRPFEETPNIAGTRYINDVFLPANVASQKGTYLMRYDVANDNMEFKKAEGQVFVLNKNPDSDYVITFNSTKEKYSLLKYNDKNGKEIFGYLKQLAGNDNITLYKRERINFVPEKIPKNGYEDKSPAKYQRGADEYYLKTNGKIEVFPSNKKKLLALYPDKKQQIETFLKEVDPSFKTDQGLSQITQFISTL